ncbi:MAG: hypothetical protein JST32_21125, partial [Bacteroidetes bacterium]|nr:hypothetical protein [Bacteroidota bacterium]
MDFFQPNGTGNKFRAILLMTFIEMWLVFGLFNFWDLKTGRLTTVELFSINALPFIGIFLLKWIAFIRSNAWKDYQTKFNTWTPKANKEGTIVVISIT